MLIDFVEGSVREILSEDADVISRLAATRKRCEGWLQIEVLKRFIRQFPDGEITVERAYPSGDNQRCDLWCREADGGESWVELKTIATNYERQYAPTSARPITNQITDAVTDIGRLAQLPAEYRRHLFLLAYPMPASATLPEQWSAHLNRLRSGGRKVEQVLTAPISIVSRNASVVGYTIAAGLGPTCNSRAPGNETPRSATCDALSRAK
jgi:hypothetical protein